MLKAAVTTTTITCHNSHHTQHIPAIERDTESKATQKKEEKKN